MVKRKTAIIGAMVSGVALSLTLVSPAGANGYVETKKWGDLKAGAGQATFFSKGETVQIVDRFADGRGVLVYVGGRTLTNRTGGTKNYNLSFPEGKRIKFNICLVNGSDFEDGTCAYSTVKA
ncbi:hypothetical protein ACFPA8_14270 [Streptomyces ovatisporus]|uniref:Secreted protein n=1 Tax=Streptomyces ovatisporus TaxID=1128682 RepID=A0ABV9A8Q9_9ACTN